MIVWKGLGFVVPVSVFGCSLVSEIAVEAAFKDDQYYQSHGWPKLAAFSVAAALIWMFDNWLGRFPKRRLIDADTGQEVQLSGDHSFFFVPIKWWVPICLVLGMIMSFVTE